MEKTLKMLDTHLIDELPKLKLSFAESLQRLAAIGIERYTTDLSRMERIYYARHNHSHLQRVMTNNMPKIASIFAESKVIAVLRQIQGGKIDYDTFLREIAEAGVCHYSVFLDGKAVMYCGRHGEMYIEKF